MVHAATADPRRGPAGARERVGATQAARGADQQPGDGRRGSDQEHGEHREGRQDGERGRDPACVLARRAAATRSTEIIPRYLTRPFPSRLGPVILRLRHETSSVTRHLVPSLTRGRPVPRPGSRHATTSPSRRSAAPLRPRASATWCAGRESGSSPAAPSTVVRGGGRRTPGPLIRRGNQPNGCSRLVLVELEPHATSISGGIGVGGPILARRGGRERHDGRARRFSCLARGLAAARRARESAGEAGQESFRTRTRVPRITGCPPHTAGPRRT
jgi:hypothetical protein